MDSWSLRLFGVISHVMTRRRELAWRRTEFLFKQAEYLEDDAVLVEMLMILENRHAHIRIEDLFDGREPSCGGSRTGFPRRGKRERGSKLLAAAGYFRLVPGRLVLAAMVAHSALPSTVQRRKVGLLQGLSARMTRIFEAVASGTSSGYDFWQ